MARREARVTRGFLAGIVMAAGTMLTPGAVLPASAAVGDITTYAGGGAADGGPATNAPLGEPDGLAVGPDGAVYIADSEQMRVRRVGTDGVITTFAGTGVADDGVDGGQASSTPLNYPRAVAVDTAGHVYISERFGHRVRRVDATSGVITTVAGTGDFGVSGDSGPATAARLYEPDGLAFDGGGNLFIADTLNNRIRMVTPGGTITTVAGTGVQGATGDNGPATAARLGLPGSVAVDGSGNVFVGDGLSNKVRRFTVGGSITTVAGTGTFGSTGDDGPATSATFSGVAALAVDSLGRVLVGDGEGRRIRRFTVGGTITTVAGTGGNGTSGDGGPATAAPMGSPESLAASGTSFLFGDAWNLVRRVDGTGTINRLAGGGMGTGGSAATAPLYPGGLTLGPGGDLYVAEAYHHVVRRISPATGTVAAFAGNGQLGYTGDDGPATAASFKYPTDVAFDPSGNAYVTDDENDVLRRIAPDGTVTTVAGTGQILDASLGAAGDGGPATSAGLRSPYGVAVDGAGNIYVAQPEYHRVRRISPSGSIVTWVGTGVEGSEGDGGPATAARLSGPNGLAFDDASNLYIADSGNDRIRKVAADGTITTFAGTTGGFSGDDGPATAAQLDYPWGLDVGPDGSLYVADSTNHRVRRIDAGTGTITTVAGSTEGFAGDGGPATAARLDHPRDVAVADDGTVFVSDTDNGRIRRIAGTGPTVLPRLAVSNAWLHEPASRNAPMIFEVTRTGDLSGASSVTVALGTGTATLASDYVDLSPFDVAFAPGEDIKKVSVQIRADNAPEFAETVVLRLLSPVGAVLADDLGEGVISDFDPGTPAVVTVADVVVAEGAGSATVTFTRSGSTTEVVSVKAQTQDATGAGVVKATAGADYTALPPTTVRFLAGETAKTLTIPITGDAVDEGTGNEVLWVTTTAPGRAIITDARAVVTIVDDDGPVTAGPATWYSIDDVRVFEGNTGTFVQQVTVRRTGNVAATGQVTIAELSSSTATPRDHDTLPTQTISFGAGEAVKTVPLTMLNDTFAESAETVQLRLSAPAAGAVLADDSGSVVIISEDAGTPASVAVRDATVEEGDGGTTALRFTLVRSGANVETTTVRVVTAVASGAGMRPAAAGSDYTALASTLVTFRGSGATEHTVTVQVAADALDEQTEHLFLVLSSPVKIVVTDARGVGTILDDD